MFSLYFPLLLSKFLSYSDVFDPFGIDFLYVLRDLDLVSVFFMWIYSFSSTISWRVCLFSNICFWQICRESDGYSNVRQFLELLFHLSKCMVFCASTMLFLLLWLSSRIWSQEYDTSNTALLLQHYFDSLGSCMSPHDFYKFFLFL
jgi:hypothetical protein